MFRFFSLICVVTNNVKTQEKNMKRAFGALLLGLFFVTAGFTADNYEVDPVHTNVGFSVSHLLISKVSGRFTKFTGTIRLDEKDPAKSSIQGTILISSITTNDEKRDTHLKSPDFFDVETYPEITFVSSHVEKRGNGYLARGKLTIRGITKEVEMPVVISGPIRDPWGNTKLGIEASLKINRQDFGVSWNQTLDGGGVVVGDEVEIRIDSEALKKS